MCVSVVLFTGVTLTFDNLMSAAATGDLQMLGQAVTRNSPLLKYKNSLGQSVTHVAAMNGHARCVVALLEEAKMSPLDKDVVSSRCSELVLCMPILSC